MRAETLIWRKRRGNAADFMTVGLYVTAMAVLMTAFMGSTLLFRYKAQIGQISRKYILRMETVGYLTGADRASMEQELAQIGVVNPDFTGSTMHQVGYGEPVVLAVKGQVTGLGTTINGDLFSTLFEKSQYEFYEQRVSTAKN